MPRKTKESEETSVTKTKKVTKNTKTNLDKDKNIIEKSEKKAVSKRTPSTSRKKVSSTKSETSKKVTTKSTVKAEKAKSPVTKTSKTKSATPKAKSTTSKSKTKSATTKSKTKRASSAKKATKTSSVSILEYYDLPYRYNKTIVKILAQTPQMLFVYWDISDDDRKAFEEHYGNDFFSKTKPVLIIHNETMNYSFEIEINDFANCWYLHVNDANCKYVIELGRRPYSHLSTIQDNYIYVTSSNEMDAPNNHILFEKFNPNVTYKNTKTGATSTKDFSTISNYKNMQQIYNIYDLYKQIYKDELFTEITTTQSNPSSTFK